MYKIEVYSTDSVFDSDVVLGIILVPEYRAVGKKKKNPCPCGAQCTSSLPGCWGIKWKIKIKILGTVLGTQ